MQIGFDEVSAAASQLLQENGEAEIAGDMGWACAWLEACAYPGLTLLIEALDTTPVEARHPPLAPDVLGLDLQDVSCVFQAPRINQLVAERGRLFLRNVRHGLYLVPFSVKANIGIGCPVDPSFALGGERTKNPYEEKLALARQAGITMQDDLWTRVTGKH